MSSFLHIILSSNQLSEMPERRIFNEIGALGLALQHDGERLASSGVDGTIRVYDLPSRSPIATLRRPESRNATNVIVYHPTEEELAAVQDNCVVLWRQKETPSDWVGSIYSHDVSQITGIAYCENGTRIYTTTTRGVIKLWANTTTRVQELPAQTCRECY